MLWKLSGRNLFRQKRRTMVSILATATGVLGMLFYLSIMNGMVKEIVDSALGLQLSSLSIEAPRGGEEVPFRLPASLLEKVSSLEGVEGLSGRVVREALVASADVTVSGGARGVRFLGVDPSVERSVSDVPALLEQEASEGEWLSETFDPDDAEVVIGRELAQRLNVRIGEPLIVTILRSVSEEESDETEPSTPDTRMALRVKGIFVSNNSSFEKTHAFVHRELIYSLGVVPEGTVHLYAVRAGERYNAPLKGKIAKLLPPELSGTTLQPRVFTWKEKAPLIASTVSVFDTFNYIFLVIIFMAAALVIVNTMLMVVQERFREFGILKAVGASPAHITWMILLEGVYIAILGSLLGFALSLPLLGVLYLTGINLGVFAEGLRNLGIPALLQPFLYWKDIFFTLGSMAFFTALGTLYPAFRAARISTLRAINFH